MKFLYLLAATLSVALAAPVANVAAPEHDVKTLEHRGSRVENAGREGGSGSENFGKEPKVVRFDDTANGGGGKPGEETINADGLKDDGGVF